MIKYDEYKYITLTRDEELKRAYDNLGTTYTNMLMSLQRKNKRKKHHCRPMFVFKTSIDKMIEAYHKKRRHKI